MSQYFFYSHGWITFVQVRGSMSPVHLLPSTALSTGCAHLGRRVPHGDPLYPQGGVDAGLGGAPRAGLRSPSARSGSAASTVGQQVQAGRPGLSEPDPTVVLERPRTD